MKFIVGLLLLISAPLYAQQITPEMDAMMRQQYTNYLTPQQQVQLAQTPPAQRMQVLEAMKLNNNTYAIKFIPQSGPMMGQTMWTQYNPNTQSSMFSFLTALGAVTKSAGSADFMETREPISAYRSPDPEETTAPADAAIATMDRANGKLKDMKNPQKPAECQECITDPAPTLTAPPISGKGTIRTSNNGQTNADLNADIKCSYGGEIIEGKRLTFKTELEVKVEHNKVTHLKYVMHDGNKTCVADLNTFKQRTVSLGSKPTTNVVLFHPNNETFVVVGTNSKSDPKNPSVTVSVNQFRKFCPQMNDKVFMQIEANPKTGTCR